MWPARESGEGPRETGQGTKMENAGFYTNVQYLSRELFVDFSAGVDRRIQERFLRGNMDCQMFWIIV
jgi:hypothetical protein